MDYGGTNIKAGLFDGDGGVLKFLDAPLNTFTESGNLVDNLVSHAKDIIGDAAVVAGGLAIKGLINSETGILVDDIGAGALLAGRDLRSVFGEPLGIPFAVENDARAYAWGEWKFGAGKGSRVMVCLTLGTGLGGAVVNNGSPYQGADALGGILGGHISIDKNGPECPCGHRGCAELYCSATALAGRIKEAHADLAELDDPLPVFFQKIESATPGYGNTLRDFQQDLSICITNAIHAYGPETVVLGGGVMNSADLILPHLRELVGQRAWTIPRGKVSIQAGTLGNRAAAIGAAFHPALDTV